ncbi:MAG: hypothetical protein Q7R88_02260 [bacterium]|nr:hypothetical protein [bacterium]
MKQKRTLNAKQRILTEAAKLILRDGPKGMSIKELARNAKTSRMQVYNIFGTLPADEIDPREVIFESGVSSFLKRTEELIILAVEVGCWSHVGPVDRLTAILRGTLLAFRENSLWGRVVLRFLDLQQPCFKSVHSIFNKVDGFISEALEKGDMVTPLPAWQVRQVLFSTLYGLLRALYFDEGNLSGNRNYTENEVQQNVLHVLTGFCAPEARNGVERTIQALQRK